MKNNNIQFEYYKDIINDEFVYSVIILKFEQYYVDVNDIETKKKIIDSNIFNIRVSSKLKYISVKKLEKFDDIFLEMIDIDDFKDIEYNIEYGAMFNYEKYMHLFYKSYINEHIIYMDIHENSNRAITLKENYKNILFTIANNYINNKSSVLYNIKVDNVLEQYVSTNIYAVIDYINRKYNNNLIIDSNISDVEAKYKIITKNKKHNIEVSEVQKIHQI